MDDPHTRTMPLPIIGSPKRKRPLADTGCRAASPLRPRTEAVLSGPKPFRTTGAFKSTTDAKDTIMLAAAKASDTPNDAAARLTRDRSPHSHMSEEFRYLHIHPPPNAGLAEHPQLSFRGKDGNEGARGTKASAIPVNHDIDQSTPLASHSDFTYSNSGPIHSATASQFTYTSPADFTMVATPRTPPLKPISPADTPARTISPLHPLAQDNMTSGARETRGASMPASAVGTVMEVLEPLSPTSRRPHSPPLSNASLSALTWTPAEITGHLLNDPLDDGTGINGIGFKPTPQIAQQRAARRRQQVADWKTREAREARSRRAERRGRGVGMGSPTLQPEKKDIGVAEAEANLNEELERGGGIVQMGERIGAGLETRRVRFIEG